MNKTSRPDFRFADEDDVIDIANLVNEYYDIENKVFMYRKDLPFIATTQIEHDITSPFHRWLLVETPRPEEIVIGAVRLTSENKIGKVDVFCVLSSSHLVSEFIVKFLLSKVELIAMNLGLSQLLIAIPEWREDIKPLLEKGGYIENSGYMWPHPEELLKPTMILEYQKIFAQVATKKDLTEISSSNQIENELTNELESCNIIATDSTTVLHDEQDEANPMKGLINTLFQALHDEYDIK